MPPKFRKELNGSQKEQQALLESSDEDFFLKGPIVPNVTISNSSGRNSSSINKVQSQVDEVVDMMQTNIGRVLERGEKLEDLQDKSDNLMNSSQAFRSKATSLRKNLWWKECRMRILLGVVIVVILAIIITAIVIQSKKA